MAGVNVPQFLTISPHSNTSAGAKHIMQADPASPTAGDVGSDSADEYGFEVPVMSPEVHSRKTLLYILLPFF